MDGVTSLLDVHRCLCNQDFKPKAQHKAIAQGNGAADPNSMDIDDKDGIGADKNALGGRASGTGMPNAGLSNNPNNGNGPGGNGDKSNANSNLNMNSGGNVGANATNAMGNQSGANTHANNINPTGAGGMTNTGAVNNNNGNNNNSNLNALGRGSATGTATATGTGAGGPMAGTNGAVGQQERKSSIEVADSDILSLRGHCSEVFVCAWNPRTSVLATGSGDSTARIWPIPTVFPAPSSAAAATAAQPIVLPHGSDNKGVASLTRKANDVTTLDWNPAGTLLASGSYDGCARIWTESGDLKYTMSLHKGPLFSLKWNKKGNHILTGSVDQKTAVWNAETGKLVKEFRFHDAPTLDVDWRDDDTFASCSTDKMIYMCSLDSAYPVRAYEGHEDEINCLKFDPSGSLLASCSDDYTARIWSTRTSSQVHCLREHTREVYTMQWCPNVSRRLILATASFDALVKMWDVNTGRCIKTLTGHTDPVYSLAYSPNGQFLASGSFDRCLNIWSSRDGSLVKQFRGAGGIFEVAWNPAGDKVSACFSSNAVCVIDLRKMVSSTVKLG